MKQNLLFIIYVFSFCVITNAQSITFSGYVKNEATNTFIDGASVVVKLNTKFLGYDYTDENGYYEISINTANSSAMTLEVNSLGFNTYNKVVNITNQSRIERDILLSEKIENLATVVIKSREKIAINRDTIVYRLSSFKDGTEKTVEDMLKNLPGIEVDAILAPNKFGVIF